MRTVAQMGLGNRREVGNLLEEVGSRLEEVGSRLEGVGSRLEGVGSRLQRVGSLQEVHPVVVKKTSKQALCTS